MDAYYISDLIASHVSSLQNIIERESRDMANGVAADYADYKRRAGRIAAFNESLNLLSVAIRELEQQ